MPHHPRRTAAAVALLVLAPLAAVVPGAGAGSVATALTSPDGPTDATHPRPRRAKANTSARFISVWVNNVENLETSSERRCRGDYGDLVSAMRRSRLKPDLFLVQQISGSAQLATYTRLLSDRLGERYRGVLANPSPKRQGSPCGAPKAHQTNAVIYRARRFEDQGLGARTWRADRLAGGRCRNNPQDRSQAVKVQLFDKIAQTTVVAASIHWPTGAVKGPQCSEKNGRESAAEVREDGYAGSLHLVGGDTNYGDRGSGGGFRPWHRAFRRDFTDAIHAACRGRKPCLRDNATIRAGNRIDYLFARDADGPARVEGGNTLGFAEAGRLARLDTGSDDPDLSYSDHKAVSARVYY